MGDGVLDGGCCPDQCIPSPAMAGRLPNDPSVVLGNDDARHYLRDVRLCVALGTVASYIFHLKARFSWKSLVRPLAVSPLVLLPLMGTLQGRSEIEDVQLIWFGLLAFQNGFFWRVVFDRAKPTTRRG